jgi:uncharacterized ferredoxin-like protein
MIIDWDKFHREKLVEAAMEMAIAARTAPKGRGRDLLHALILTGEDKDLLAARMEEFAGREGSAFFARDAANLREAPVILLLGTGIGPLGLSNCGYCGRKECDDRASGTSSHAPSGATPCAVAVTDLGIAVGSAVSVAAARHIDNRVWFSAGRAALEAGLFPPGVTVAWGIPLSATGKNPFFDRQATA